MFIGFLPYAIAIFIATGLFILLVDANMYKKAKQKREHKASLILSWMNIVLGLGLFLANWIYNNFLW
ncbi:CLC_0170 family protein [Bacillus sp. USDA818B3_A]|uniref:CLC_0170 family protein n=1 Tax=Bacillus sp. USDA818B3_A TaxID=2698834 RepID=UPI001367E34B|nr:CLC_0170 family protein [Bacillus sp. USDA818B3_A]